MLLPAHSSAPSGRDAPRAANGSPSNGSSRASTAASQVVSAASAARSASSQAVAHAARRGAAVGAGSLERIGQRAGRGRGVGVDERGRQDGRVAPAAVAVDDELDRLRVGQHGQQRLGRRGRPEPDHELGQMRLAPRSGADQVVAVADDMRPVVRPAPNQRQRVGEDRIAGRGGEPGERGGQPGIVLRTGHDQAALDR